MSFSLDDLAATIRQRLAAEGEESYTVKLARKGVAKCAEKFGEEAVEAVVAAAERDPAALRAEAADVLYHLLVLLEVSGVAFEDVLRELEGRTKRSGLEEKAARRSSGTAEDFAE